jgi:hypothetical protein
LLIAHRLLGHAALDLDTLEVQGGLDALEDGAHGGEFHGIARTDSNARERKAHSQSNRCEKSRGRGEVLARSHVAK